MEQKKETSRDPERSRILEISMAVILLVGVWFLSGQGAVLVANMQNAKAQNQRVVAIDSGHGGTDPGKVGVNAALEKEINLQIAKKLKKLLEAEDVKVIMTREDDQGLYDEGARNKKAQDMKNRCSLIGDSGAVFTVSIHQNSYHEEYVKGAQTFYHGNSEEGKELAERIQAQMIRVLDPENKRMAKANTSYYLLKNTAIPTVIVECGFLSNWEEAVLLASDAYQERVAWAVHMGVMQYLNARR